MRSKKTMDCPRCGSINLREDGIVGGRQFRYYKYSDTQNVFDTYL